MCGCVFCRGCSETSGLSPLAVSDVWGSMLCVCVCVATEQEKLNAGHYRSPAEAAEDIRLIWTNCMEYNRVSVSLCVCVCVCVCVRLVPACGRETTTATRAVFGSPKRDYGGFGVGAGSIRSLALWIDVL